jgi:hypothetical protein
LVCKGNPYRILIMKDHECVVQDAMDSFISRSLKNWAARQSPPSDGKERLLRAAQVPPPVKQFIVRIWLDKLFSYKVPLRTFDDDIMTVPFTQSRIWSFHITTSIRFVA